MRTKTARPPRIEPADLPAKPSLPKQPTDGANWHDWLTLGVFFISTCMLLMGIAAVLTLLSRMDSQDDEIKTLKTNLELLSNQDSPSVAESLKQQHTQSMNGLISRLDQRLNDLKATADPRLDTLGELKTQVQKVETQLKEIEKMINRLASPDAQQTAPSQPATEPAPAAAPSATPEPPQPQPVF